MTTFAVTFYCDTAEEASQLVNLADELQAVHTAEKETTPKAGKKKAASKKKAGKAPTVTAVRNALKGLVEAHGKQAGKDLLAEFEAANVSELDESQFEEVIQEAKDRLDTADANGEDDLLG